MRGGLYSLPNRQLRKGKRGTVPPLPHSLPNRQLRKPVGNALLRADHSLPNRQLRNAHAARHDL